MDGVRRLDDNCILIFHFVVYPQVIDLLVRCWSINIGCYFQDISLIFKFSLVSMNVFKYRN